MDFQPRQLIGFHPPAIRGRTVLSTISNSLSGTRDGRANIPEQIGEANSCCDRLISREIRTVLEPVRSTCPQAGEPNPPFYNLYKPRLKSTSVLLITAVLGALLCLLYNGIGSFFTIIGVSDALKWLITTAAGFPDHTPLPVFLVAGTLRESEVRERTDIALVSTRVSAKNQENGTSLGSQEEDLTDKAEDTKPDEIHIIGDGWESAKTMARESIDETINRVEGSDETYLILYQRVDRLSRADPLEAATALWILKKHDAIFYFGDLGFTDLEDVNDQLWVLFKLVTSREEYEKIRNRSDLGDKKVKEQGKLPGPAPYGLTKGDGGELERNECECAVINRAIELVLGDDLSVQTAHETLRKEYKAEDVNVPAYSTLLNILRREMYTGVLKHDGEVVNEDIPVIIEQERFDQLQEKVSTISQPQNEDQIEHEMEQIIKRFGVEPSLYLLEDILKPRCPKCGGDVRSWGTEEVWGNRVVNYRCEHHPEFTESTDNNVEDEQYGEGKAEKTENNENICGFEGPLLSEERIRELDTTGIVTCPVCQRPADDEDWKDCPNLLGAIQQTCDFCGNHIVVDLPKNKYERAMEQPEIALKVFEDDNRPTRSTTDASHEDQDDGCDRKHVTLEEFSRGQG